MNHILDSVINHLTNTPISPNTIPIQNSSFEEVLALGIDAPSGTVDHYYSANDSSGMTMRTRQISDTVFKRFSERRSVEALGSLTGGLCPYCGGRIFAINADEKWEKVDGISFEWDHLIPASLLGLSVDGNLCPACKDCNQAKSDMDPQRFFEKIVADPTKSTLYETLDDFRKFLSKFSRPYRKNYPNAFARSKTNSESGVTLEDLEAQISALWGSKDANGDKILTISSTAKRASQLDDFFEAFKNEYYPKKAGAKSNAAVTPANKLQEVCDGLYDSAKTPSDLKEWPIDVLWTAVEEYLLFYRDEKDTLNNSGSFGARSRCVRDFAAALDRPDFNAMVEKVPTYKLFMEFGFITPLSAIEETRLDGAFKDAEDYASTEGLSATDTKTLLEKAPNFRDKLRVCLNSNNVSSSSDLEASDILDFFNGYVSNYKRGEASAKKFCSMYTKQLPAETQFAIIQAQLARLTESETVSIDQLL